MSKDHSDVFICRHARGGYWAHPSPFVAHGAGFEIQFRNLTDDTIEIDFRDTPVHKTRLSLAPRAGDYVIVNGDAQAGLYTYRAAVGRRKAGKLILVRGGSPPTVIIDT